jgi:Zn-finger nucleic acid-binding protein
MPFYDVKCSQCDFIDNWFCLVSEYEKNIQEKKCPKCDSILIQDFENHKVILIDGIAGYSKIKPSILKAESDALRENESLEKRAKKDKRFLERSDEIKRLQDRNGY